MRHLTGVRSAFAVAVAAVVLLGGQPVVTAQAAPTPSPSPSPTAPTKIKDAKAQVQQLEEEASQVGEDYDAAAQALDDSKQRLAVLEADIASQQKKVDALGE